jgi:hypothetical protein
MISSMNAMVTPMAIRHATVAAGDSCSACAGAVAVGTAAPAVGAVSPAGAAPAVKATARDAFRGERAPDLDAKLD